MRNGEASFAPFWLVVIDRIFRGRLVIATVIKSSVFARARSSIVFISYLYHRQLRSILSPLTALKPREGVVPSVLSTLQRCNAKITACCTQIYFLYSSAVRQHMGKGGRGGAGG